MSDAIAVPLLQGWQFAPAEPGAAPDPSHSGRLAWCDAVVPGTVAAALGYDAALATALDEQDWWYRVRFPSPAIAPSTPAVLEFEGLATLGDAWLNGEKILAWDGMFTGHSVDVTGKLRETNELAIRFASLGAALAAKRPRPRWKTALVRAQNLRWHRATLLGRMPGWNPRLPAIGPWKPITLKMGSLARVDCSVTAAVEAGVATCRATVRGAQGARAVRLTVHGQAIESAIAGGKGEATATLRGVEAPRWFPHTHGEPALVDYQVEVKAGGAWHRLEAGRVGFREVSFDPAKEGTLRINGLAVFCRGPCWSSMDLARLHAPDGDVRAEVERLRDLGANMIRVGGTMSYESDAFYAACDALGVMVWQDFMFANFDFPVADAGFAEAARAEAQHQLGRLSAHTSIAVYCGGSEVAQQAAMMGLPEPRWSNAFFLETLPQLCHAMHPGVPYVPSTPWGGALPFHVGTGVAHYYGVGAYRRPFSDLRTANVRFSAESLAFSQVPEPASVRRHFGTATPPPHAPEWASGVPRDMGAGWDFEDVRDHYLRVLHDVDPVSLRSQDLDRYHELSRRVPGEVMLRAYGEWRRAGSPCGGALVWLHRDVRPGAGWGLVDVDGERKAACWMLKRAWSPIALHITDEGLDGYAIHVNNEGGQPLAATVELRLLRDGRMTMAPQACAVSVPARGVLALSADAMIGMFTDLTDAYRFGPAKQDVVAARLVAADAAVLAEDFAFPLGHALPIGTTSPRVELASSGPDLAVATIESEVFLQSVRIEAEGWEALDNYFHVLPGIARTVTLRRRGEARATVVLELRALNLAAVTRAELEPA